MGEQMKVLVASSPTKDASEVKHVIDMFDHGLETFHLRKPKFSTRKMVEYINMIPEKYHGNIVIHSHHELTKKYKLKGIHLSKRHRKNSWKKRLKRLFLQLRTPNLIRTRSCNQLSHLVHECNGFDYVLLSPVFDGISKNQQGAFSEHSLAGVLSKVECKVYAMGGVTPENIRSAERLGFDGVVLMGAVWKGNKPPLEVYLDTLTALANNQAELALETA